MSIQDIQDKINVFIANDAIFYSCLIVVVGVVSFLLGRESQLDFKVSPLEKEDNKSLLIETSDEGEESTLDNTLLAESDTVVGSVNGTKYHLPWCAGAQRILPENLITFSSTKEAKEAGYTPASNCAGLK